MTPLVSSAIVVLSVLTGLFGSIGVGAGWIKPPSLLSVTERRAAEGGPPPFTDPLPPAEVRLRGPASVYGNLSPAECRRRLQKASGHEAFSFVGARNGIAMPVRFIGPLHGVTFKVPPAKSPYGALDCRQALLWTDVALVLHEHGVTSVNIDNFYRDRARVHKGRKSQHAYGLAADITVVTFGEREAPARATTGARLPDGDGPADVEEDFLGKLGAPVCGPEARIFSLPDSDPAQIARAIRLRDLVCDLARRGLFHHILTPNYNLAHKNHLHLDLQRDNRWLSVN